MGEAPRVLFRADAGRRLGSGHVRRCLALADALSERGATCTFAVRGLSPALVDRLRASGMGVVSLTDLADGPTTSTVDRQREDAAEMLAACGPHQWDAVVVDHYSLDHTWEDSVRPAANRVVAIDDLANRRHSVDLLVDHNWYGPDNHARYAAMAPGAAQLLGPRYALLDRAYRQIRRSAPPQRPPKNVLVNFGGTDAGSQTATAVTALLDFGDLMVDVVLGSRELRTTAAWTQHPRVRLHWELPNLAALLASVDLAIGASGTATWERLCLNVPAIVTTTSGGQSLVTRALAEAGMTLWLGTAGEVTHDDYVKAIRQVTEGQGPALVPVVDGYGTSRVAMAVLGSGGTMTTRLATCHDAATVATSGPQDEQGPAHWHRRHGWFHDSMTRETPPRIVVADDVPMGLEYADSSGTQQWIDPACSCPDPKETQ